MDKEQQAYIALKEASLTVREYKGSNVSKHAVALLDALYDCYCLDLINVRPEGLVALQSALKQVTLLRNVFTNDSQDVPKI